MATSKKAELQATVMRRVAMSVALTIALVYVAWAYVPIPTPATDDPTDRLIFALRWCTLSLVPIIIGINVSLIQRF